MIIEKTYIYLLHQNETKFNFLLIMETTTYYYTTLKGNNVETFDSRGYVTLERNGLHIYEHHFGSLSLKLQEQILIKELESRNIKFTKIKK